MIQQQFEKYLQNLKISFKSLKNYRSDINHFLSFVGVSELSECVPFLSSDLANNYKQFMLDQKSAIKTVNRRLSTLRKLSKFLHSIEAINFDFAEDVANVGVHEFSKGNTTYFDKVLKDYKTHLLASKASKNTVKNYLSDVRHFLSYLANN